MVYSEHYAQNKLKIPVPISIGIILVLILFLARFFSSSPVPTKANRQVVKNLQVSNPSPSEFSLFWQTDKAESGWVIYGLNQNNLDRIALDERDIETARLNYFDHFIVVKGLQPDSTYYYKIVSNDKLIESAEGNSFSFKTPSSVNLTNNLNPAYGKVLKTNGQPLQNALVLLSFKKAYPLLTLTKTTGEWLIPLNSLLDKTTMKSLTINETEKAAIVIYGENDQKTNVTADLSTLSPLPQTLVIGKDYDFISQEDVLSAVSDQNQESKSSVNILFPKEASLIPGGKPLIKGTALPGREVVGNILGKKKYSFKSVVDNDGLWTVIVTEPLESGDYVLSVSTIDSSNKTVQLKRSFSIAKSGERVMGVATGEATPTVTSLPTAVPTVVPTVLATTVSTVTATPPTSGLNIIPFGIGSASLIILGLGILLAF